MSVIHQAVVSYEILVIDQDTTAQDVESLLAGTDYVFAPDADEENAYSSIIGSIKNTNDRFFWVHSPGYLVRQADNVSFYWSFEQLDNEVTFSDAVRERIMSARLKKPQRP